MMDYRNNYVKEQIELVPEYYPMEWIRSYEERRKSIDVIPMTEEEITEYKVIFEEALTVCSKFVEEKGDETYVPMVDKIRTVLTDF